MKRNIAILGTPISSGNRGVLALGASLVTLCSRGDPEPEITLLIGNHRPTTASFRVTGAEKRVPVVNYRRSPRSKPSEHMIWILAMAVLYRFIPIDAIRRTITAHTPWIQALCESDLVGDIRGGDSFSDIYGMARFCEGFVLALTVLLVKGDLVQFPQTYGPFKRPLARAMARFLMRRSSIIIARDLESQRCAQALLPHGKQVLLCPDVAFALAAECPETVRLDPPQEAVENTNMTIGINVNGLMYNGGYSRSNMFELELDYPDFLHRLITAMLDTSPDDIWLVPHTFAPAGNVESDNEACRQVRERLPEALKQRVRIVAAEYDQHEIKGVIGMCDFFVGSRMHACIAALSQGIPCVGIAYSRKFRGVFTSVGMQDWVIEGGATPTDEAVTRVLDLYHRRNPVREPLQQRATRARKALCVVFDRLLNSPATAPDAPVQAEHPSPDQG